MPLVKLLSTSRVAAEATAARLAALGIEAEVIGEPNVFVKVASGGNYRVQVIVDETQLARAKEELARLDAAAGPRVAALTRQVRVGFLLGSLPALALALWLLLREDKDTLLWIALVPAWLVGLMAWAAWSRRSGRA
ncbi:MAG TPA: hypothetical protein VF530_07890 [Planctomycetota bacterium]